MIHFSRQVNSITGLKLNKTQLTALQCYEKELIEWNKRYNLTAIQEIEQIRTKHFLDSLTCLSMMQEGLIENIIDIGTGAGFPGIPIKIACPGIHLTLLESVGKKADFCRHIVECIKLENVEVIQERAETLGQMPAHRQHYDWALARAVAELPVLVEYMLPLVRLGGGMIAMKGENAPHEAQAAEHAIHLMGGRLRKLLPVALPGVADERYLVVIDKIAATPPGYPRRVGIPAKRPL